MTGNNMKIGILNSGGYNFNSIKFALNRLGITNISYVKSEDELNTCDKIIIPGVGHAKTAMDLLNLQNLTTVIKNTKKPVLGICLGMQIMCQFSEEGNVDCIGVFDKNIVRLPADVVTPQMGWNKLIGGKYDGKFVYFANSFYLPKCEFTENYVDYCGIKISAMIRKDNFLGCQFHPEKSGEIGEKILSDFVLL
ncbi:imidazole glycerol phosphate synthase subunit HisH [Candidatus Deianiraea vastatrix]|uniref:Imidazole glycerol phosphate synthase subunit HisH n=1 Tax=Candidatus Deianiraea vastatrix TaxID=2163644 RepID=A0A5B8XF57_9RICK|nr:imidazole glycerol phosphate synthase subunit HisH [Candidatus Deianiraea vastatrix]QED23616.1 Imidazole glycerol phosphate synthase subunit HisH [Candidatus Deianiraea vastatrix]